MVFSCASWMAASVRQLLKRVAELEDELLMIKKLDRQVIELDQLVGKEYWGGLESQQTGSDAIYGAGLMNAPVAMFYTNEANLDYSMQWRILQCCFPCIPV